ncbi:hypothetical protein NFI96_006871 [Prochilodus magdalenae]|nr:hypothetical protein NFI96_006871 [Prochilodus magdalenae]
MAITSTIILALILLPAAVSAVTGYRGHSVQIRCSYESGYETYMKYLCRGECSILPWETEDIPVQSGSTAEDQRFSLDDDTAARVFTITITDLRPEDKGTYWCGIQRSNLPDIYTEVLLQVKEGLTLSVLVLYCRRLKRKDAHRLITPQRNSRRHEDRTNDQSDPADSRYSVIINPIYLSGNLDISESDLESAYQSVTTSLKPADPVYQNMNPSTNRSNPVYQSMNHTTRQSNPVYESMNPNTTQPGPVYQSMKPISNQPGPVYQSMKPSSNQSDPVYQSMKPSSNQSDPVYQSMKPSSNQSDPVYQSMNSKTSQLDPVYQSMNSKTSQSVPVYQSLNPNTNQSNSVYHTLHLNSMNSKTNNLDPFYQSRNPNTKQSDSVSQSRNPKTNYL